MAGVLKAAGDIKKAASVRRLNGGGEIIGGISGIAWRPARRRAHLASSIGEIGVPGVLLLGAYKRH